MEHNFDLSPRLGSMAQNVPKMAQNLKMELLLQFWARIPMSSEYNHLTMFKNCWTKILIWGPVFGLCPKRARNGPTLGNSTSPSVFGLEISNAQIVLILPCPKNCWTKILIWGPILGLLEVVKASNIHNLFIFSIWKYLCNIFWCRDLFGGPRDFRNWSKLSKFQKFCLWS